MLELLVIFFGLIGSAACGFLLALVWFGPDGAKELLALHKQWRDTDREIIDRQNVEIGQLNRDNARLRSLAREMLEPGPEEED